MEKEDKTIIQLDKKTSRKMKRKIKNDPVKHGIRFFDYSILFLVIVLVGFGLVMIYSSSAYNAQITHNGDSYYFVKRQAIVAVLGFICMFVIAMIPHKLWKKIIVPAYIGTVILLGVVLVSGRASHGQRRWIEIFGFQFQPSEVAKAVIIVFLAAVMSKNMKNLKDNKKTFRVFLLAAPVFILVLVTNMSTSLIIAGIVFVMIFVASDRKKVFLILIGLVGTVGTVALMKTSYRLDRINAWINVETADNGYQTRQGLYAIGSGGWFGKGLGHSIQKLSYVPEAHNDMIFSIICEELGLFGAISLILLFLLLLWRCMILANNAPSVYSALIVVGIMTQIALQVIVNIGVVTNTIPNTGVPLPFISYGGTSLLVLMCEVGLLLNISRSIRLKV